MALTDLKLSEAIRLGSMLRPHATGALFTKRGSCALGAAFEATGLRMQPCYIYDDEEIRPYSDWANALAERPGCPDCGFQHGTMCQVIGNLNDRHGWTRERIADWVATLEPQSELQPVLVPVLAHPAVREGR